MRLKLAKSDTTSRNRSCPLSGCRHDYALAPAVAVFSHPRRHPSTFSTITSPHSDHLDGPYAWPAGAQPAISISSWCSRAKIYHRGGVRRRTRICGPQARLHDSQPMLAHLDPLKPSSKSMRPIRHRCLLSQFDDTVRSGQSRSTRTHSRFPSSTVSLGKELSEIKVVFEV
ncbi:hypothetical protein BCR44DRAFT_1255476 [Catenaria anguillulae PL171]|uniref:Uncharacterized protein n=1 Tax=Catenaria anguillulae PL171 TaxID=765915 RepID=A0A1Y2HDA2_9FUNG|nr:hypothetical protein BCR44DRAFT_1255476 [Catenaria anguillulae PL171]